MTEQSAGTAAGRTRTGGSGDVRSDCLALARRILCCPDCRAALQPELHCPDCRRSFAPDADGIISALPALMQDVTRSKQELQARIDSGDRDAHAPEIVLYEKAFHDEQAHYYDQLFADPLPLSRYYNRVVGQQIRRYVEGQSFVVDLCCGTGKSSMPLVQRGFTVVAVDVSRGMLREYKRKCEALGRTDVLFIQADASNPPLQSGSCAAITMLGGLHHIQEQTLCVETCARALEAGGILILHEPLQSGYTSRLAKILENVYALMDPRRVWSAVARRLHLGSPSRPREAPEPLADFTPYEKPFHSADELIALMPADMEKVEVRSQGMLSFREFPHTLQNRMGIPMASMIVSVDAWLSARPGYQWAGDALFTVFRKAGR